MRHVVRFAPLFVLVVLLGCAAGPVSRWDPPDQLAGFWAGLWHGMLLVVTLVVSFFTHDVSIYEIDNAGVAYNIGFVLGVLGVYGSGTSITVTRRKDRRKRSAENRFRARIEHWIEDEDWDELGEKIERRIKSKLRRWLEEDDTPPSP